MGLMINRAIMRAREFQSADLCIVIIYSRRKDGG
jgi:hypothetical protein